MGVHGESRPAQSISIRIKLLAETSVIEPPISWLQTRHVTSFLFDAPYILTKCYRFHA